MALLSAVFWAAAMLIVQHGTSSIITINLSDHNLSSVPNDLPETIESLDLSCNHIHQLHHGDFKNTPHLTFLNLSWNALEIIDPETFRDTPRLEYLDLSHNRMQNLLHQEYLFYTKNLLKLNLACNIFPTMTLGGDFNSLLKLEELSLGAKNIRVGDFKNLSAVNLHTLAIYLEDDGGYEVNSLEEVTAQRLQIAFTNNHMDLNIVADGLSFFDELELMGLTDHFTDISDQLRERQEIRTSHILITNITIKWDDLTNFVKGVLNSSMTNLTATDMTMTDLPYDDTDLSQTTNLRSFLIRRAEVKSFFFSQEAVYNFLINMPVESMAVVDTSIIHMTCPKLKSPTTQLDFSNCALADSIFSRVEGQKTLECETLVNVKTLILVGNNLKNLQLVSIRIQHMISLRHLDLSLNSLTYKGVVGCAWPLNVSHVNLSYNGLTESIFKCLPNRTKTLDLKNNQVSMVPSSILNLNYLSSLDLTANRLRDLPVCHGFPVLNQLLLRANSLHAPSVKNLDTCPHLQILDVSHNPFICTCAVRSFINLGIKSEQRNREHTGIDLLKWPQGYLCTYPEAKRNSTLKNTRIPALSCNVGLLAATILVPAVVVIIATVILCHRLDVPWYMGMIWQWTRAKHRARTTQIPPEDLVGVEFHAFVSYSNHDEEWINNSLLPNLEGPAGLRICHHRKNFIAGRTIKWNIINCVEKSRRSLFVLSAHFVKSDWCHYELYFSTHRLDRGSDSVVLVLLEPLPQYLIPSKYHQLKSMMSRHTYLEWPQDRAKHRLFWANLRAALQADLPHARRNEE